jgi:hypothetical protein
VPSIVASKAVGSTTSTLVSSELVQPRCCVAVPSLQPIALRRNHPPFWWSRTARHSVAAIGDGQRTGPSDAKCGADLL